MRSGRRSEKKEDEKESTMRGWIRISRDRIRALLKRIKRPYSELEAWLDIEASVTDVNYF